MPVPLIEFPADDPDRARRFWHGVLGAKLAPRPTEAASGFEIEDDGLRLGVHERGPGPTIGSVAAEVGYGSSFALSAAFKREHGISPQEHRARAARG